MAACRRDLLFVTLKVKVEMAEDMVLQIARRVADLVELRHPSLCCGALADKARAGGAHRGLHVFIRHRLFDVGLELAGGGFVQAHASPSPMAGVSV